MGQDPPSTRLSPSNHHLCPALPARCSPGRSTDQELFQRLSLAHLGKAEKTGLLFSAAVDDWVWGGSSPSPSAGDVGPGGTEHPQCQRRNQRRGDTGITSTGSQP